MTPRPLCDFDEMDDPGSLGLVVEIDGWSTGVMVVRVGGEAFGYVNSCPHIGAPLNWQAGQFLDSDKRHILCANHGALFDIPTGECVAGPCFRKRLTPYPLEVRDGKVYAMGED